MIKRRKKTEKCLLTFFFVGYRHYLIVSAVTNLLVNLMGVWFFRNYARINLGKSDVMVLNA